MICRRALLSSFVFSLLFSLGGFAKSNNWDFIYCVPVEKIDFSANREIVDGKDLAYLLLLRSYISSDPTEAGILEGYEFSPDGKTFTGRLSQNLKWSDGSIVTPLEAGEGIAKALPFRAIGKRIKVSKAAGNPSGVKIIDQRTFQIIFETEIENPTGVLREAFSTNSRHNRFWLTKNDGGKPDVIAKNGFLTSGKQVGFLVGKNKVLLADKESCKSPDFTIFIDTLTDGVSKYEIRRSPYSSAITLQPNSTRLTLIERKNLVKWVRGAFAAQAPESGIQEVKSFFFSGEPGFSPASTWENPLAPQFSKKIKIAYEIPVFKAVLEAAAKRDKIEIEFIPFPFSDSDVDAQVMASGIQEGRHVILQDVLQWPHVKDFMKKNPKTRKSLEVIAEKSASTIPPDNRTLHQFEVNAVTEQSLAPVARKYPLAYSKPNLQLCLQWTKRGELYFASKEQCVP